MTSGEDESSTVLVTKIIKADDRDAIKYIGKTVYGISGYPYGTLEVVNEAADGGQEFWVRNNYGLIMFSYFCLRSEDWKN